MRFNPIGFILIGWKCDTIKPKLARYQVGEWQAEKFDIGAIGGAGDKYEVWTYGMQENKAIPIFIFLLILLGHS